MIPVQAKAPLSLEQAHLILENLSLLTTDTHKNSKLVFYDTKIALEPDSSTKRTISSWTSPIITTTWYLAGYEVEFESRDLASLFPLMERVHQAFIDQKYDVNNFKDLKQREELAKEAENGLNALIQNKYLTQPEKIKLIDPGIQTVKKIQTFYQQKIEESHNKMMEELIRKGREDREAKERELNEKEKEIARLRQRVSELEKIAEKDQNWLQLIENVKQESEKKLAAQALNSSINLETVPTHVILERAQALLHVLTARQPK